MNFWTKTLRISAWITFGIGVLLSLIIAFSGGGFFGGLIIFIIGIGITLISVSIEMVIANIAEDTANIRYTLNKTYALGAANILTKECKSCQVPYDAKLSSCPKCGFCPTESQTMSRISTWTCKKCNSPNNEGTIYCKDCGASR
jgi:hypothetical protein